MRATFGPSAVATPANGVTVARIVATPVLVVLVSWLGVSWATVACWLVLAGSDSLDGWLARRYGPTTSGAFLDPLADKILVLAALAAMAARGWVAWVPVTVLAAREIVISAYRTRVARHGVSVPARRLGKAKTAAEDLSVALLLLPLTGHHLWVGRDLLWVAVGLAVISGAQYLLDGRLPGWVPGVVAAERARSPVAGVPAKR